MQTTHHPPIPHPIYNYNMCVRLSMRPTTVSRFNWLAESARTVGQFRILMDRRNRPGQSDSAGELNRYPIKLGFYSYKS
jgi:hypothetical protein